MESSYSRFQLLFCSVVVVVDVVVFCPDRKAFVVKAKIEFGKSFVDLGNVNTVQEVLLENSST